LIVKVGTGSYVDERTVPTVAEAVDHWFNDREGKVKANTLAAYGVVIEQIRGPVLVGSPEQKAQYRATGKVPKGAKLLAMLGTTKLSDLTTADIRSWHRRVAEHSGAYTANRAKSHLRSILALAEEDFGVRAPSMPSGLGRGRAKAKKTILSPAQTAGILEAARHDPEHGIYYAFPFLAGTRPSEQLGLLWREVDFERNVVLIRRIQERDGSLTEMTKTEAGTREVPMGAVLREMLLAWRVRCPRKGKELHRVFPGPAALRRGRSRGPEAVVRSSTRTFGSATGSRRSSASAFPTSRRTRLGTRSSRPCRRRGSRWGSSPRLLDMRARP
jgi:integrase